MMASWTSCLLLCSSFEGVSSLVTATTPRRSFVSADACDTSVALISTCSGSARCSQPGCESRRASRTGSWTDPRPRTRMWQPVSLSICFTLMPRGPRMRPMKLHLE
ncbi:hypothetical protein PENTCL1PPCAC_10205 [Pristionchus entomophagus]|uniref:Secreted protein n=1 Tax=Pristionchus entomophagus TaxID=358040 RepID=A0AAV5SZ37_9BILA|nr:hypothetical protein PENTCL1PPCAC_10205 [Pristionchus entomophagus]